MLLSPPAPLLAEEEEHLKSTSEEQVDDVTGARLDDNCQFSNLSNLGLKKYVWIPSSKPFSDMPPSSLTFSLRTTSNLSTCHPVPDSGDS